MLGAFLNPVLMINLQLAVLRVLAHMEGPAVRRVRLQYNAVLLVDQYIPFI